MYRIYNFLLAVRNQRAVVNYGYSWFTRMSKGGVRQTTVDGLPPRLTVYRVATPWLTLAVVCQPLRTLPPRCPSVAECTGMCGIWRCPMAVCARPRLTVHRTYFMSCAIAGHVAGLVVLNVSPVWVSCGWSVRPLLALCCVVLRWRPYRVECTGSLPTSEVKRRRAQLVLGWGTAREDLRVLPAFGC